MPDLDKTAVAALDHCAARADRIARLLETLASTSSLSADLIGTGRSLEVVAGELAPLGFELTRRQTPDGRLHLEAFRAGREDPPAVLLLAHVDAAVAVTEEAAYVVDGARARGPGVAAMKAGVVTLVTMVDTLHGLGMLSDFEWRVLITSDGAQAGATSRHHVRRLAGESDLALVFGVASESGEIVSSRAGAGRYRVHVSGQTAGPDGNSRMGRNAIIELAHKIPLLSALSSPSRGVELNIGVVQGGERPDVVPEAATLWLEARCQGPTDAIWLDRQLAIVAADVAVSGTQTEVSGSVYRPPWPPSAATEALVAVWRRAAAAVGIDDLEATHAPTSTDANLAHAVGVPTLDGLGPSGGGLSTATEWIDLAGLPARVAMSVAALVEWRQLTASVAGPPGQRRE